MPQISILGCGWLGLPLAKALIDNGYLVKGSTTSQNKLALLDNNGIRPYLISLSQNEVNGDIAGFLEHSEILIIDVPPKLRTDTTENFVAKIKNLIPHIELAAIPKIIFVSSTSVYADDNTAITETTVAVPETESGRQLLDTEALLMDNKNFNTTAIRFAGLIGEDRHPVRFLAAKENVENPDAPINFIHQLDCIGIILRIIQKDAWNQVFNAATPYHPNRESYYTSKALANGLLPPTFNHDKKTVGKTILSHKLQHPDFGYQFVITDTI